MSRGAPFLRFFEPAIDPSIVEDISRLLDYLNNIDKERLPRLLQKRDDRGYSLLHYAAQKIEPESLVLLLVNEADPNIRSSNATNEITPLHLAAKHGNLTCLERLVESGGNPLAKDAQGKIPRDYAQENGQELCLEFLQKQSVERVQQETENLQGLLSTLQLHLDSGNVEAILEDNTFSRLFGGDSVTPSSSGKHHALPKMSPLDDVASRRCNLLNSSALVSVLNRVTSDIPVFLHSASLLHAACHYGNTYLMKELLNRFPSLLYATTPEGYTALHIAVSHGHHDSVLMLIDAHKNITRHRSASGALPRPRVSSSVNQAFITSTTTGHTAVHFAATLDSIEILNLFAESQKLLSFSFDDQHCGYTPLHLAVYLKKFDAVKRLLASGANPNTTLSNPNVSTMGSSPLAEATMNKDRKMVELLVEYGAEDRRRDALSTCLRQSDEESQSLIPLLLGSLVKCDETGTKQLVQSQSRKEGKRHKMAAVDWGNLDISALKPDWVRESLVACPFFRQQGLESPVCFDYVNSLNLCKNKLSIVPEEVFYLKNLTSLNLSMNKLAFLPILVPNFITDSGQPVPPCPNLNRLNLSSNQLANLPEFLFSLPNLSFLDASKNLIKALPFSLWCSPKLNILNCSYNHIEKIPTNWPDVKSQYQIVNTALMSPTQGSVLSSPRSKGSSRKVSADINGIHGNSSVKLDSQQTSDSSDTDDAASITPAIARQTRLYDRLNVCNANLTIEWDISEGREETFDGLNSLNLSYNSIKSIPPNLPCLCPKLTKLDLSHNEISELALPRAVPSGLKKLDVSHNHLLVLDSYKNPVESLPCTNPKTLAAITDGIISVDPKFYCSHRSHSHLISLDILNASHNEITDVKLYSPIISVAEGPHSRSSKIREIDVPLLAALASASSKSAESVRHLAKLACPLLTRLVLHHNNIPEVPLSVCEMTNLNSLDLSYNPIIELRPELGKLSNIWDFPLDDLKLISPPHNIIERGKAKDIIGFLWSLLQRARPYHRMKLMVVGKASRGKTTLLKKISERGQRGREDNVFLSRMNPESRALSKNLATVGIVVSDWTYTKRIHSDQTQTGLRNITFMTWDFGGQEEYYATHQCFLSRRSLYLVVWNVLDGRAGVEELRPWLLNIQARAPHSPVIIVGTHLDKVKRSQRSEVEGNMDLIERMYGSGSSLMRMKHGFPTIMENVVVSSVSGKNINDLRDKIFNVACNVKENTVAGRAVGGGRNPEYRLLMDQLVPASYLQLEDSVRNIALNLRYLRKPPVLTYKEFRDQIYADARPLIGRDIDDKELEQAVRFLHENGTLIHYDDPFLKELYFVDPQWLSDMLAHIVTVREINPFVKDGVMRIKDFVLLFNEKDFPIKWQKEYLRLLTTFEVAVEFKKGKLLIPSHLPEIKPDLPKFYAPENTVFLPPLRHTFVLAFVPSGFWPRLMSRVLSDKSIIKLAQTGCGLTDEETKLLKWTKWRTGMVLKFGNVTLLSLEELSGKLFNGPGKKMKILVENSRWDEHSLDSTVYGINIEVPDIFPLLRYAELHPRESSNAKHSSKNVVTGKAKEWLVPPDEQGITDEVCVDPPHAATQPRPRRWTLSERIGTVMNKVRTYTTQGLEENTDDGKTNDDSGSIVYPGRKNGDQSSSSDESEEEREVDEGKLERVRRVLRIEDIQSKFEKLKKQRAHGISRIDNDDPEDDVSKSRAPTLTEENNDKMRAGLISKVVDHITLLVEDWFLGVRPRILVVPCPHCSRGLPPGNIPLLRSFSVNPQLRPPSNAVIGTDYPYAASAPILPNISTTTSQTGSKRSFWQLGRKSLEEDRAEETNSSPDITYYAFQYDECVVQARDIPYVSCPNHQQLPLEFIAPDTLFLSEGKNILLGPDELHVSREDTLGRGAFATVYKAKLKKRLTSQGIQDYEDCVVKALGRKLDLETDDTYSDDEDEHGAHIGGGGVRPRPMDRAAIISGFNNLKKELSILSPLRHSNVVELFGVSVKPLGLVLELAPKGDLKSVLKEYKESQNHIQPAAIQSAVIQIAGGLNYLHSLRIIYRDLKSENILVWAFPSPHTVLSPTVQVGTDTVKVKISDYGISQFVTSQGAKGHVGTPGFMAPEILKYLGKEAYNEKVDLFSYAMVIYEMITFRVPFEHLTPNQANQANESGTRPTLKKKDLPCPVLIRELMVWCWQQEEKDRPSAQEVVGLAKADQFLRLADAIRINNFGSQVTGSCCRIITSSYNKHSITPITPAYANTGFFSPRSITVTNRDTHKMSSQTRKVQTISSSQPYRPNVGIDPRSLSVGGDSEETHCSNFENGHLIPIKPFDENINQKKSTKDVLFSDAEIISTISSEGSDNAPVCPVVTHPTSLPPLSLKENLQEDSPSDSEQEESNKMYQIWAASCFNHCSVVTVMEYCGQFVKIEDVDLGDSPVLCISMVKDKVWMGFEIGYLCIYDANNYQSIAQVWLRQGIAVLSISYIQELGVVYVGMADGSVKAFTDILDVTPYSCDSIITTLTPVMAYQDTHQASVTLLPVPINTSEDTSYHLWVGQKNREITILNAKDLSVVDFVDNKFDKTPSPRYLKNLSFAYLTCATNNVESNGSESSASVNNDPVFVYGALQHGQFISCWNAVTRDLVICVDCQDLAPELSGEQGLQISALCVSNGYLYAGLVSGEVLILAIPGLPLFTILHCHRSYVNSFLPIDLRKLLPSPTHSPAYTPALSPLHPFLMTDDNSVTFKTGPQQFMSFGTGFRAYYESSDSIDYSRASFSLVWEAGQWNNIMEA